MAQPGQHHPNQSGRGFASMDEVKQRDIASRGGQSVPGEKRSFSQDHGLASEAGRKGGQSVPDEKRSFSQDRELAAVAGRKGGQQSHGSGAGGAHRGGSGNFAEDRQRASEAGRKGGQH